MCTNKLHDVNTLDVVRGILGDGLDFVRLSTISQACAFFVIRAKFNLKGWRVYSHPINKGTGLICDQSVMLTGFY